MQRLEGRSPGGAFLRNEVIQATMTTKATEYYKAYESDPTMTKTVEASNFSTLFRFADKWDIFLMVIGSLFAIGNGVSLIFYALPFGRLVAAFDPGANPSQIVSSTLQTVFDFLINSVIVFLNSWFMSAAWTITSERQMIRARRQYFGALLRHETAWHDRNKPEEICSRMYIQIADVHQALINNVTSMLSKSSIGLTGIIVAVVKGWRMAFVMLAFLPVMVIAGLYDGKYIKKTKAYLQRTKAKVDARVIEVFDSIKTVKTLDGQQYQKVRFQRNLEQIEQKTIENGIKSRFAFGVFFFCILINYTLGFWYGAKLVSQRTYNDNSHTEYSISDVIVIFFTIYMSNLSLSGLPESATSFLVSRESMTKIINMIDRQTRIIDGTVECPQNIQTITFKDVNFCFEKPLFDHFNLTIRKGFTAFIGESGNGKTTIVSLICRFYDIFQGDISFESQDGRAVPLNSITFETLRKRIGYVGQEPVLIGTTLREVLGGDNLKEEEIQSVLQDCQAWSFVKQIGLDSTYQSLSGGQKQRIAIARAVINSPEILILDEGTSALDRKNEQQVLHALKRRGIPFIIMIAHRLETIAHADAIIVLEKGKLKCEGTYSQLVEEGIIRKQHQQDEEEEQSAVLIAESIIQDANKKVSQIIQLIKKQQDPIIEAPDDGAALDQNEFHMSYIGRLVSYNDGLKFLYVIGLTAAGLIGAIFPIYSYLLSRIIVTLAGINFSTDPVKLDGYQKQVASLSLTMFIISFAGLVLTIAKGTIFTFLTERLGTILKRTAFEKLIAYDLAQIESKGAQPLAAVVTNNCDELKLLGGSHLSDIIENLVTILTGLLMAFAFSWHITLVSLLLFPVIILCGRLQMSFSQGMTNNTDKEHKKTHQMVIEAVMKHKTVKSLGIETKLLHRYEQSLSSALKMSIKYGNLSGIMFGLGQSLISILLALIFFVGSIFLREGLVTVLNLYTAIYGIMFAGVQAGGNMMFIGRLALAKTAAISFFNVIDQHSTDQAIVLKNADNDRRGSGQQLEPNTNQEFIGQPHQAEISFDTEEIGGQVQISHIFFGYAGREDPLFKNFSLKIPRGQKVALVGQSGSGKSTVSSLLLRLYEPSKGVIYLDKVPIIRLSKNRLRRTIGIVNQQPVLFNRSVYENICYNSGASFEDVIYAARRVNIYDIIMKGQFGYKESQQSVEEQSFVDTIKAGSQAQFDAFRKPVGPKGSHLSGGQKQRIAIARALVRKPKILILDQATSALDTANQQLIQQCVDSLKDVTQLVIAHRLSTVEKCDRIVVMKSGEIVEEGTYDELLREKGYFYQLVKAADPDEE